MAASATQVGACGRGSWDSDACALEPKLSVEAVGAGTLLASQAEASIMSKPVLLRLSSAVSTAEVGRRVLPDDRPSGRLRTG